MYSSNMDKTSYFISKKQPILTSIKHCSTREFHDLTAWEHCCMTIITRLKLIRMKANTNTMLS
jgi:hypothetical protein